MIQQTSKPTMFRRALASVCFLWLAGCTGASRSDRTRSRARRQTAPSRCTRCRPPTSAAAAGGWRLVLAGVEYPFDVGGVGVGGLGLSTIEATGEVYNLRHLRQFPGTYGQARYGFAIGTASGGDLWLQTGAGVILHLKAKRTG